ncbi:unnamed protein product [Rhizopus stolonifer]
MNRNNHNNRARMIASGSNSGFVNDQNNDVALPLVSSQHIDTMNQHYAYAQGVEAAAQDTVEKAKKDRPKNTTKSYKAKKKKKNSYIGVIDTVPQVH